MGLNKICFVLFNLFRSNMKSYCMFSRKNITASAFKLSYRCVRHAVVVGVVVAHVAYAVLVRVLLSRVRHSHAIVLNGGAKNKITA